MKKIDLNIQMFGSTNKTTNYDLPQWVGTDKPSYLTDFNDAFNKIDTGMHANATKLDKVDTLETQVNSLDTDVSNLNTRVGTAEATIQTVSTTATNASNTATSALNTANTANSKADTNASNIASLSTRIGKNETDITTIESSVNLLENDKANISDLSYSTSEVKTAATFIDGKPIYKKTIEIPQFSDSYVNVFLNISNIDKIIDIQGMVHRNNGKFAYFYDLENYYMSEWAIDPSGTGSVSFKSNSSVATFDYGYITLLYTKTTDNA